ncbi:w0003 [Escherichia coli]|nr:w0003 [Escherichia coli]
MLSQWHVYVVIVERRSFSIVAAVELDDARKLLQMTGEWLNTTEADQQSPEHRS